MTPADATRVLHILATADGRCQHCACRLFTRFARAFPEHTDLALTQWRVEFPRELDRIYEKTIREGDPEDV